MKSRLLQLLFLGASVLPAESRAVINCPEGFAKISESGAITITGKRLEREDPAIRSLVKSMGEPGRPGGVTHSPARNQMQGETCWSYALNGLAEAGKLEASHEETHLAPEYLQFYNIYFQLKKHSGEFRQLAKELDNPARSAAKKARQSEIRNAYDVGAAEKRSVPPEKIAKNFFVPDMGNYESDAMEMVEKIGLVPIDELNAPIKTKLQEKDLEHAVRNFIGNFMLDQKNLDRYKGTDKDGINSELFNDLAAYLKSYVGPKPLRPGEEFTYRGKTYTPVSFMQDFMNFNPKDFKTLAAPKGDKDLALEAIASSIDKNIPVPISIHIYSDPVNSEGLTNFRASEESGVFTAATCPKAHCEQIVSGHEILAVNYLRDKDTKKITGIIVKNSWGERALDVNGNIPPDREKEGYYVIAADYLQDGLEDFTLKNEISKLFKFKGRFEELKN